MGIALRMLLYRRGYTFAYPIFTQIFMAQLQETAFWFFRTSNVFQTSRVFTSTHQRSRGTYIESSSKHYSWMLVGTREYSKVPTLNTY